jgi:hypothetical protein
VRSSWSRPRPRPSCPAASRAGLLPSLSLPDPALELRTRYLPGHERALLGADFFDALSCPTGPWPC